MTAVSMPMPVHALEFLVRSVERELPALGPSDVAIQRVHARFRAAVNALVKAGERGDAANAATRADRENVERWKELCRVTMEAKDGCARDVRGDGQEPPDRRGQHPRGDRGRERTRAALRLVHDV